MRGILAQRVQHGRWSRPGPQAQAGHPPVDREHRSGDRGGERAGGEGDPSRDLPGAYQAIASVSDVIAADDADPLQMGRQPTDLTNQG